MITVNVNTLQWLFFVLKICQVSYLEFLHLNKNAKKLHDFLILPPSVQILKLFFYTR